MNEIDPTNVSSNYLAEVLGLTRHGVGRLYATGVIQQNGVARGKYSLFDAVPAYLDHLRANKGSDVEARLKLAQVEKIKNQIEKMKNDLVRTSDAAEVFRVAWTALRDAAMQIPKRVSRAAKLKNRFQVRKKLADEINELLYESEKPLREYFGDAWNDPKGK